MPINNLTIHARFYVQTYIVDRKCVFALHVSGCILEVEAHFILGFEKFDLICTALISSLPHFWLLAGKETVFHEQTVYPISMVQTDSSRSERGRKSKAQGATLRKLLDRSQFIFYERAEWNRERAQSCETVPIMELVSDVCGGSAHTAYARIRHCSEQILSDFIYLSIL